MLTDVIATLTFVFYFFVLIVSFYGRRFSHNCVVFLCNILSSQRVKLSGVRTIPLQSLSSGYDWARFRVLGWIMIWGTFKVQIT